MPEACNFKAPNGKNSQLYKDLETKLGPDLAAQTWNYVYSKEFTTKFGQWSQVLTNALKDYPDTTTDDFAEGYGFMLKMIMEPGHEDISTDTNGEPTADWVLKKIDLMLDVPLKDNKPVVAETPKEEKKAEPLPAVVKIENIFGTNKKADRIPFDEAKANIEDVLAQAQANPNTTFDLSYFSPSKARKVGESGYSPIELAAMFSLYPIPANVKFTPEFQALMENTPGAQRRRLSFPEVHYLNYDEGRVQDQRGRLVVEVKDAQGNLTGQFFSSAEQIQAINTIVSIVQENFIKEDGPTDTEDKDNEAKNKVERILGPSGLVLTKLKNQLNKAVLVYQGKTQNASMTKEEAANRIVNLSKVINSYGSLTDTSYGLVNKALYRLNQLGIKVKVRTKAMEGEDGEAGADINEESGRGLIDWSESSFNLDPKDTASARIKLFIASIQKVDVGPEREPRRIHLSFSDKAVRQRILGLDEDQGRKTISIIPNATAASLKLTPGATALTQVEVDGVTKLIKVTAVRTVTAEDMLDPKVQANAEEEGVNLDQNHTLLQLEDWIPRQKVVRPLQNFIGFSEIVDFESLFQDLLETTLGHDNTIEGVLRMLDEAGKDYNPVFTAVASRLRSQPIHIQREFVTVMSKQFAQYQIALVTKRRSGFLDVTPINANRGSMLNNVINTWKENQKNAPIIVQDTSGNLVINKELAKTFYNRLVEINDTYKQNEYPNKDTVLIPLIKDLLDANGIVLSEKALDYLLSNIAKLTENTQLAGGFQKQFSMTADGKPEGLFSTIIAKLNGIGDEEAFTERESSYLLNNNPLHTEKTAMQILARVAMKFSDRTASGTHKSSQGKNVYDFVLNDHLSLRVAKLKKDTQHLLTLKGTLLGKDNWLVTRLMNEKARADFGLMYMDGLKESYKEGGGIERSAMSPREQLVDSLSRFMNQGNLKTNFVALTLSDKTKSPIFTGLYKIDIGPNGDSAAIQDEIYNIFKGEFDRVKQWSSQKATSPIEAYKKGGGLFYAIPEMNWDALQKLEKDVVITKEDIQQIWLEKGVPNLQGSTATIKNLVMKVFYTEWLAKEGQALFSRLYNEGIVGGGFIDYSYMIKNLYKVGIGKVQNADAYYDLNTNAPIEMDKVKAAITSYLVKDYLLNYFVFNRSMSVAFSGDPAFTFKGKEGQTEAEQIEATMKEYQKRLAGLVAPGEDPTWDGGRDETYTTVTLQDDERVQKYLENVPGWVGKTNATDAQELTTVREHLYVMKAKGLIEQGLFDEMIAIIDDGLKNRKGYYEFTDPRHTDVVMQIMKPVYYSDDFSTLPGNMVIHYVKSSSMPLYPPMTRIFQIDDLRMKMEGQFNEQGILENHVPRANYISAKKEGAPTGKGTKIFDDNGDLKINDTTWDSSKQVLRRDGFRIQQTVPYDETKAHILTISQLNKLLTESTEHINNFQVRGVDGSFDYQGMTGAEILKAKEQIRKDMVQLQYEDLLDRLGAQISPITGMPIITDYNKIFDILREEAISRSYPANDLAYLEARIRETMEDGSQRVGLEIPLYFNASADRFEQLLLSLVKQVSKVYLPGKSYIQAASSGFRFKEKEVFENLSEEEKAGIVWIGDHDGTELKTIQKVEGAEALKGAQVLIPFNFLIKDKSGKDVRANVKDFMYSKNGKWYLDETKVPKELTQMIGARIPNQGHNSMLPIEVAGFVPANMGDVIIVPAAITTQMGADFDVDKLYTYRRSYRYEGGKFSVDDYQEKQSTYSRLGANDAEYQELKKAAAMILDAKGVKAVKGQYNKDDFNKALGQAVSEKYPNPDDVPKHEVAVKDFKPSKPTVDQLANKYFDLHWAVLTHPDMYEKILRPLDKEDLKDQAKRFGHVDLGHYYSVHRQLNDFMSQKDAKVMVGISSLFVTFNSIVQNKNLFVGKNVEEESTPFAEDNEVVVYEGKNQTQNTEPNGIRFIEEGSDRVSEAFRISGTSEARYFENDVEERLVDGETKKVFVDPNTDKILGDYNEKEALMRTKHDNHTTIQSEVLDHAKNRTIDNLNLNLNTVYAWFALNQMSSEDGKGVSLKMTTLLMKQPAIVEYVNRVSRSQDTFADGYVSDISKKTIESLIDEYLNEALGAAETQEQKEKIASLRSELDQRDLLKFIKDSNYDVLKVQTLKEGLSGKKDSRFYLNQVGALLNFYKLDAVGKELGKFQKLLNQDTAGPGSNMVTVYDTINSRQILDDNPLIANAQDLINDTEQGFIHFTLLNAVQNLFGDLLPFEGFGPLLESIKGISKRDRLSIQTQRDIISHYKSFIYSGSDLGLVNNASVDRFRLIYGNDTEQPLARRVWEAKQTWGKNNYFLNRLNPQQGESSIAPSYVFYQASKTSDLDDQENTGALLEMLTSENPEEKALAHDLVRYAFLIGGLPGTTSFIKYIPEGFLRSLPFATQLRKINKDLQEGKLKTGTFVRQLIQHNPSLAPKITEGFPELDGQYKSAPEEFSLLSISSNNLANLSGLITRTEEGYEYPQYISYYNAEESKYFLYESVEGGRAYRRIDTLGSSYTTEFNPDAGKVRSIFTENRAFISEDGTPSPVRIITGYGHTEVAALPKSAPTISTRASVDLGIEQPTYKKSEVTKLLADVSKNPKVGQSVRIVANELSKILKKSQIDNPLSIEFKKVADDGRNASGTYYTGGKIEIYTANASQTDPSLLGGTLVHETIHGISVPFSSNPALRAKYPKINKVFNEVENIRAEARQRVLEAAIAAGYTKEQLDSVVTGRKSDDSALIELAQVWYATGSTEEFMANILENKATQKFLNNVQRQEGKRTVWQEVINLLTKFLTALAEELGVSINENSLLEQGLMNTFKYLNKIKEVGGQSTSNSDSTRQDSKPKLEVGKILQAIHDTYFSTFPNTFDLGGPYYMDTEQEAKDIVDKINKNFVQVKAGYFWNNRDFEFEVTLTPTGLDSPVFTSFKETKDPIDKVVGKLQEQIQELRSGTGRQSKDIDVLVRQQLIADARANVSELTATRDLTVIKKIAKAQVDWAQAVSDKILVNNKTATTSEIMTAMNLLGTWSTLVDSVYGETPPDAASRDQEFYDIENKATDLLREFTRSILKPAHKAIIEEKLGVELKDSEYNNILDIDTPGSKVLSIERAKSRVIQAIGTLIQNTNRAYLEDGDKVVRRIQDFEKELSTFASNRGMKQQELYDMFFQENDSNTAWGLVGPISGSFYGWHAGLKKTLMADIDKAQGAANTVARNAQIRQAWNNYWHRLSENAQFIDPRKLVAENGTLRDDPVSRTYIRELEAEYGQEKAEGLVKTAKERYARYTSDKEEIRIAYEGQVQGGLMTQEQMDEKMLLWDENNSPYFKMRSKEGVLQSMVNFNLHERYLHIVPKEKARTKKTNESFYDSKYEHIKQDPELMKLYTKLKAFMAEFTSNLPWYLEGRLHDNFLPVVRKSLVTDITQLPAYIKSMPEKFIDSLTASSYEELQQARSKKEIPIMYMEGSDKNADDIDKRSRDIPRILELFGLMSYHYLHFSQAKDGIDMGETILKKADEDLRNGNTQVEKNGRIVTVKTGLPNILGSLEYTRDALMYKTTKNLEMKLGDWNRRVVDGKIKKVKDLRADLYDLQQKHDNNELTDQEFATQKEVVEKELQKYDTRKFYGSKIGDSLIKWTQRNALSYNPLSAINNFVFGVISSSIHANGKGDFNWKEWRKAFSIVMNATGRSIGLARLTGNDSAMHTTAEKILNIMDRMGIMGELTDSEYGKSNIERRKAGWKQTLSPYQMLRTGDYFVKALNTVATLINEKVTVNGKEMSAWDAIDRDGHWLDKTDKNYESENPMEQLKWNKIRNRAITVNKIVMGNQDKSSPVWAKKNIIYRLLGQFRMSWLADGFSSRFDPEWDDINLGRKRKGRYRTFADLGAVGTIKVLFRQVLSTVSSIDPYNSTRKTNGEPITELDKENMRRNLAELGWFIMLFAAVAMINAIPDDDDDDSKRRWKLMSNMLIRSYQDVSLYASPAIFDSVLGTAVPAITTIKNAQKALFATWKLMYDDDYTWNEWMLKQTKAGWLPETTLINKFKTMTERDISTLSR